MENCPYDFMIQNDEWFYWHKCVMFDKLTPEQATTNTHFNKNGWKLLEGMKYGGWTPSKNHCSQKEK